MNMITNTDVMVIKSSISSISKLRHKELEKYFHISANLQKLYKYIKTAYPDSTAYGEVINSNESINELIDKMKQIQSDDEKVNTLIQLIIEEMEQIKQGSV